MDPQGHDGTLESAVDFMIAPELGGKPLPGEEVEETPTEVEPVTETEEEEHDQGDEEEEIPPAAAEAQETEEHDEAPEDTDAPEEPGERYQVKVNGEETEVTLEELKQGYSGQKYVQQGMQEAAAARKQAEEVFNNLQQERRQVAEFVNQIQSGVRPPPVAPNDELFKTDPLAYMDAKIKYDGEVEQYNAQMGQLQQVAQQQSAADQQAMQVYLQGELQQLQAMEPDFREPEAANKVKEQMVTKGQEIYGYRPEEIAQIVDHRAIRVLRDAMRYHEIQAGKAAAQEKVKQKIVKGTKSKRPTTGESRRRKQRSKLKQTGSIDDALSLMFE